MLVAWLEAVRKVKTRVVEILQIAKQINKEFDKMSQAADDIKAKITEIGTDVDEIDGDIQEVLDKLNALSGSPTPEEIDEIKTMLGAVKEKTRAVADKVPEPEPQP